MTAWLPVSKPRTHTMRDKITPRTRMYKADDLHKSFKVAEGITKSMPSIRLRPQNISDRNLRDRFVKQRIRPVHYKFISARTPLIIKNTT